MPETPHYTSGDSLNIEVRGKTPADEPPSRLVNQAVLAFPGAAETAARGVWELELVAS